MYNEALYEFVCKATPQIIREIALLYQEQEAQEQKWWKARQQLVQTASDSEVAAFDKQVYQDMVNMSSKFHKQLRELGVPLFTGNRSDPRAQQKLLMVLADLAKARV